jgi:hypothetical protein
LSVDIGFGYQLVISNTVDADAGYFEIGTNFSNPLITLNMYL